MPSLTKEQLEARRNGIGSSDVAAILGLSSFQGRNAWAVWNEKKGLEQKPSTPEQERGHDLEPVLVHWYEKATGHQTIPGGTVHHPEHAWAFATYDAKVLGLPRAVEAKAVGASMMHKWDDSVEDGIPHEVRLQCTWQMWCLQLKEIAVSAMLGGPSGWRIFLVNHDEDLEKMVVRQCHTFWRAVEAGRSPEVDGSNECRDWLNHRYPFAQDPIIREATQDEEQWALSRHLAAMKEKENGAAKKAIDNTFIQALQPHTGIMGREGWKFTRRLGPAGRITNRFTPARVWKGGDDDAD